MKNLNIIVALVAIIATINTQAMQMTAADQLELQKALNAKKSLTQQASQLGGKPVTETMARAYKDAEYTINKYAKNPEAQKTISNMEATITKTVKGAKAASEAVELAAAKLPAVTPKPQSAAKTQWPRTTKKGTEWKGDIIPGQGWEEKSGMEQPGQGWEEKSGMEQPGQGWEEKSGMRLPKPLPTPPDKTINIFYDPTTKTLKPDGVQEFVIMTQKKNPSLNKTRLFTTAYNDAVTLLKKARNETILNKTLSDELMTMINQAILPAIEITGAKEQLQPNPVLPATTVETAIPLAPNVLQKPIAGPKPTKIVTTKKSASIFPGGTSGDPIVIGDKKFQMPKYNTVSNFSNFMENSIKTKDFYSQFNDGLNSQWINDAINALKSDGENLSIRKREVIQIGQYLIAQYLKEKGKNDAYIITKINEVVSFVNQKIK